MRDPSHFIPQDSLCSVCDQIDFRPLFTQRIEKNIELGRWERITRSSKHCAFCALVAASLQNTKRSREWALGASTKVFLFNKPSWEVSISNVQYHGPISAEYSNKYDLKSTAKALSKEMTPPYRLMVQFERLAGDPWWGQIQYLADHERRREQQFFGRHVDQRNANIPLIRSWLRTCNKVHGPSCEEPGRASRRLGKVRVIDVETMIVVVAPRGCRYVALSYVWGGRQKYEARKEHFQVSPSGLEYLPLPDDLPQTILDACEVTRLIGERYIWVDSLCIIQNSDDDRHDQILRMDAIYSSAALTIVAASREHSNTGLPGISTPRKIPQFRTKFNGLKMAVPFPSLATLEEGSNLIWNTRGWTFQEKVMSKRLLMFTDYQVYFRCSNMVWCEDIVIETEISSKSMYKKLQPFRWAADRTYEITPTLTQRIAKFVFDDHQELADSRLLNYVSVVEEFTKRTLSNPADAVHAVDGILRTLKHTGPFYHGIPDRFLDKALLWHSAGSGITLKPRDAVAFPTWTWAAWNMPSGCVWHIPDLRDARNWHTCPKWILTETSLQKSWDDGQAERSKPPKPFLSVQSAAILRRIGYFLYMRSTVHRFSIGQRVDLDVNIPGFYDTAGIVRREYHLYELINWEGHCVGEVRMSRMTREHFRSQRVDFVALSQGKSLSGASIASHFIPEESISDANDHWKVVKLEPSKWEIVNVMMLAWKTDGQVAERVAIGKVIRTAFAMDAPRWILVG